MRPPLIAIPHLLHEASIQLPSAAPFTITAVEWILQVQRYPKGLDSKRPRVHVALSVGLLAIDELETLSKRQS